MIKKVKLSELKKIYTIDDKPHKGNGNYWSDLKRDMKNGYLSTPFNESYIKITKTGEIFDGAHRVTILKEIYDGDTEILVMEVGWLDTMVCLFFTFLQTILKPKNLYSFETEFKEIRLGDLSESSNLRKLNYIRHKNPSILYYPGWDDLTKSLYEDGYNPIDETFIEIDQHNNIIDGYKRVHLLIKKYGNNLKIRVKVKQKLIKKRINIKVFILLFIIILTLILILN
tara:strand:+ start:82 stop:762 length:681 start_codon:yes stop_codon:yes gene_type:complete